MKLKYELSVYFGVPGSGKTTFAAWLVSQSQRVSLIGKFGLWLRWHWPFYGSRFRFLNHNFVSQWIFDHCRCGYPVWSNVPITGAYAFDPQSDLGTHWIYDGRLIIDEAGVEFNNRNFKSFSQNAIYFFKYHRHYRLAVDVLSQSYEDMDITIRRLARHLYVVKQSLIPGFVCVRRIRRRVGIDDKTHQIIDEYFWGFPVFDTQWIWSRPLYKLFNSYSCKQLPVVPFQRW